jgi:DNA-binding HxlR family transcriptional regulator
MGRAPVIQNVILKALQEGKGAMRFSEIKKKVADLLSRKEEEVYDYNIAENLKRLIKLGLVDKEIDHAGHLTYRLTKDYYKKTIKANFLSLLERWDSSRVFAMLEREHPPLIVFSEPFGNIRDYGFYENLEFESEKKQMTYCVSRWGDVNNIFGTRMLEELLKLEKDQQEGIGKLLAWSYWASVNQFVDEFHKPRHSIEHCRSFAQEALKRAEQRGECHHVEAEKAVLEILNITEELMSKRNNLKEFLGFAQEHASKVKGLQGQIIKEMMRFMGGGEKIFDTFLELHSNVTSGLLFANLLPKTNLLAVGLDVRGSDKNKRFFLNYGDVWDDFIDAVFLNVALDEVKGNMENAISKTKAYARYLEPLLELPGKSRMCVIYTWGYQETFNLSDKDFLPEFEDWYASLKEGSLDHRSWIFEWGEENLVRAIKALRRKKAWKSIPNLPIDMDGLWGIRDLVLHHPRAVSDGQLFLQEILGEIRRRKAVLLTKTEKK